MLKINIIAIGKDKNSWVREGSAHYERLLSRFAVINWHICPALKKTASLTPSQVRKQEAESLQRVLQKGIIIALSDSGTKKDSSQFAKMLEKIQIHSKGQIQFVIGGAYGLDTTILNSADSIISLSPLTFSHQLVRLVLLEQLYRGFSILHGTDYHK